DADLHLGLAPDLDEDGALHLAARTGGHEPIVRASIGDHLDRTLVHRSAAEGDRLALAVEDLHLARAAGHPRQPRGLTGVHLPGVRPEREDEGALVHLADVHRDPARDEAEPLPRLEAEDGGGIHHVVQVSVELPAFEEGLPREKRDVLRIPHRPADLHAFARLDQQSAHGKRIDPRRSADRFHHLGVVIGTCQPEYRRDQRYQRYLPHDCLLWSKTSGDSKSHGSGTEGAAPSRWAPSVAPHWTTTSAMAVVSVAPVASSRSCMEFCGRKE